MHRISGCQCTKLKQKSVGALIQHSEAELQHAQNCNQIDSKPLSAIGTQHICMWDSLRATFSSSAPSNSLHEDTSGDAKIWSEQTKADASCKLVLYKNTKQKHNGTQRRGKRTTSAQIPTKKSGTGAAVLMNLATSMKQLPLSTRHGWTASQLSRDKIIFRSGGCQLLPEPIFFMRPVWQNGTRELQPHRYSAQFLETGETSFLDLSWTACGVLEKTRSKWFCCCQVNMTAVPSKCFFLSRNCQCPKATFTIWMLTHIWQSIITQKHFRFDKDTATTPPHEWCSNQESSVKCSRWCRPFPNFQIHIIFSDQLFLRDLRRLVNCSRSRKKATGTTNNRNKTCWFLAWETPAQHFLGKDEVQFGPLGGFWIY